jgi:hypothetical protein
MSVFLGIALTIISIIASLLDPNSSIDSAPPMYWERVSHELFRDVFELDEQITAFMKIRAHDEGFPTEIVSNLIRRSESMAPC